MFVFLGQICQGGKFYFLFFILLLVLTSFHEDELFKTMCYIYFADSSCRATESIANSVAQGDFANQQTVGVLWKLVLPAQPSHHLGALRALEFPSAMLELRHVPLLSRQASYSIKRLIPHKLFIIACDVKLSPSFNFIQSLGNFKMAQFSTSIKLYFTSAFLMTFQ